MPPTPTKDSLRALLRLKHATVIRRGKPRIGKVTPEYVELLVDVDPMPSSQWWGAFNEAASGSVLEGRYTTGNLGVTVQTCDGELEQDVRRVDEAIAATNRAYEALFVKAQQQYEALVAEEKRRTEQDANVVKRRLEDRLKGF